MLNEGPVFSDAGVSILYSKESKVFDNALCQLTGPSPLTQISISHSLTSKVR